MTAIAGPPEGNADFYAGTLGLRFVKRTVNHDDTGTYHFYFGDRVGTPGTTITFFPWTENGRQGRFGAGQTRDTAYLIRPESVEFWVERLESRDVDVEHTDRLGNDVLRFEDPDGIGLELVASGTAEHGRVETWPESPVPEEHQLRGLQGVTLSVTDPDPTESVLVDVLGFEPETGSEGRRRYRAAEGAPESVVDLVESPGEEGQMGVGTVHHVAFEAENEEELRAFREAFDDHGLDPTEVIDRKYFQSVYAHEPGGVLFEVATTGPGFTVDEDVEDLGTRLTLPEWLEDEREEIEARLPDVDWSNVERRHD